MSWDGPQGEAVTLSGFPGLIQEPVVGPLFRSRAIISLVSWAQPQLL